MFLDYMYSLARFFIRDVFDKICDALDLETKNNRRQNINPMSYVYKAGYKKANNINSIWVFCCLSLMPEWHKLESVALAVW